MPHHPDGLHSASAIDACRVGLEPINTQNSRKSTRNWNLTFDFIFLDMVFNLLIKTGP